MSDLWTEASYDAETENKLRSLEMAKHASSGLWAFLALAQSPEEYADRVALASDTITTAAHTTGTPVEDLLAVFDHRFALLMEAKDNPFTDDSKDDSEDDSKESKDGDSDDSHDESDDDDDSDDSNGDGHDDDSDEDEDSDDTGDGNDEDNPANDGSDNGNQDKSTPPWTNKFSVLAAKIAAGENPLTWGGAAPFAHSPARKHAADGADSPVTDTNTPQQPAQTPDPAQPQGPDGQQDETGAQNPTPHPPAVPGMDGGIAETTKPRQMPAGSGMDNGSMPPDADTADGITGEFDPALNGGDIEQGADSNLPGEPDTGSSDDTRTEASLRARAHKQRIIADEVHRHNPTLAPWQCYRIAQQVYDTYLTKHAEDVNPLLYGDRGAIPDGPITGPVKHWSPPDIKPPTGTPGKSPTPGAAAMGEAAEAGETAAKLLPLLAL